MSIADKIIQYHLWAKEELAKLEAETQAAKEAEARAAQQWPIFVETIERLCREINS